jgi:hypothetical protein
LLLTTVVGFIVVTYGNDVGMFGSGGDSEAEEAPLVVAPTFTPPPPTATPPTPIIIERYVYQDEYVTGGGDGGSGASSGGGSSSGASSQPSGGSAPPAAPPSTSTPSGAAPQLNDDGDAPQAQTTRTEFRGVVVALAAASLTVNDRSGQVTVALAPETEVHGGTLTVGVTAKVHARNSGGTLVATEIEVSGDEEEPEEGGD